MKDGATKSFVQAYNAQAAVDSTAQIIVAAAVTQEANDKRQLVAMLSQVAGNCEAAPAAERRERRLVRSLSVTRSGRVVLLTLPTITVITPTGS